MLQLLPPELILEIFEHGHSDECALPLLKRWRILIPFPILVSHISREWRALALHSPWLWTDIHITLYRKVDFWSLYLTRSAPSDLYIHLVLGPLRSPQDTPKVTGPLRLLIPHAARWGRLTISTDREAVLRHIARTLRDVSAPNLTSLELLHTDKPHWGEPRPLQLLGGATPRLAHLRLRNVTWDWRASWPHGLHALELDIPPDYEHMAFAYDDLAEMLHACPALAHLALAGAPAVLPDDAEPLELPALVSLSLALTETGGYARRLAALLRTPGLEALELAGGMEGVMRAVPSWQPWSGANIRPEEWEVKYPRVRTLTLARIGGWDSELIGLHFCHAFPALERLRLVGVDVARIFRFLAQTFRTVENPVLKRIVPWPNLETIEVDKWPSWEKVSPHMEVERFEQVTTAEGEAIRRLVEHRIKAGKPIRVLSVQPEVLFEREGIAAWLRERGVDTVRA